MVNIISHFALCIVTFQNQNEFVSDAINLITVCKDLINMTSSSNESPKNHHFHWIMHEYYVIGVQAMQVKFGPR